uniref:Uncharacterized protein n=1 Tax=viral metagenome TaxID=1070528 RepID=A0A6M3JH53_9ZZZZ
MKVVKQLNEPQKIKCHELIKGCPLKDCVSCRAKITQEIKTELEKLLRATLMGDTVLVRLSEWQSYWQERGVK